MGKPFADFSTVKDGSMMSEFMEKGQSNRPFMLSAPHANG